jgi:5-methylcytosine-specific restriction endonuclease McrA
MKLLIAYESSVRRLEGAKRSNWDSSDPDKVAFTLPDDARKGDRVLYFVGGRRQYFIGSGKTASRWMTGRSGLWKGRPYMLTGELRLLPDPVPVDDVAAVTGWKPSQGPTVVPEKFADAVWRAARGRPLIQVERAVEGTLTESRSRYRNPGLRRTALQLAAGRCAGCGNDFKNYARGIGERCLVVHHTKQLKDLDQPRETDLHDLVVVCANCHMMIHADPKKALTIPQLRNRLRASR